MQFRNPDILYLLFLLIIPILIHLFQFQKFKKVDFTNVKLLKQIEQQTRKSKKLKEILILISRLLVFTCLILAFSQPFFNANNESAKGEIFIYLDNSLSMQAKGERGELLPHAKQELIDVFLGKSGLLTLITNNKVYKNLEIENLKKELLKISYHPLKKDLNTVLLQVNNSQNKNIRGRNNVILISDFQHFNFDTSLINLDTLTNFTFVQTIPLKPDNIMIDSVWISEQNKEIVKVKSRIKSIANKSENLSISLFKNNKLYGKTTVNLNPNKIEYVEFSIPVSNNLYGEIKINENLLSFDNSLFFSLIPLEKPKILAIGKSNDFISKIYTEDEFNFMTSLENELDYSHIKNQNLIVLNQLISFPEILVDNLSDYFQKGGNLVVIPDEDSDLNSYNKLFARLNIGNIIEKNIQKKTITTINYDHPLLKNVFSERVDNFQYPMANISFISKMNHSSPILQFSDYEYFISETLVNDSKFYWVSSPLNSDNSNFISSPLVVPIFYNFAKYNGFQEKLFYTIGRKNEIMIQSNELGNDILHISNADTDFIPLQIKTLHTVNVETEINPKKDGIYQIGNKNYKQYIAYNYDRGEGNLSFHDMQRFVQNKNNANYSNSVKDAVTLMDDQFKKHSLWHLFVIFALLFLGMEILLQKNLKISNFN